MSYTAIQADFSRKFRLNKACAALEEQNSALEGVLAGIDYNDERKLGDARNRTNRTISSENHN